ncbi:MAG TPA: hypothetical protein VEQ10_01805, partial [Vicinamibacteria bacterium]|nr:hypothetical protein [Vicinamibacteria bacterium]
MQLSTVEIVRTALAVVACAAVVGAAPETKPLGDFEGHGDVGQPKRAGAARYDPAVQEYTLTGSGVNMWGPRDEFQFAWKRLSGDFILQARLRF